MNACQDCAYAAQLAPCCASSLNGGAGIANPHGHVTVEMPCPRIAANDGCARPHKRRSASRHVRPHSLPATHSAGLQAGIGRRALLAHDARLPAPRPQRVSASLESAEQRIHHHQASLWQLSIPAHVPTPSTLLRSWAPIQLNTLQHTPLSAEWLQCAAPWAVQSCSSDGAPEGPL
jgi:hypothetical protein